MNNDGLPLCDLAEVFSQLERADVPTLRKVQIELTRIRAGKERASHSESPTQVATSLRKRGS